MINVYIPALQTSAGEKAARYIDTLTKPIGSLGRLEENSSGISGHDRGSFSDGHAARSPRFCR